MLFKAGEIGTYISVCSDVFDNDWDAPAAQLTSFVPDKISIINYFMPHISFPNVLDAKFDPLTLKTNK